MHRTRHLEDVMSNKTNKSKLSRIHVNRSLDYNKKIKEKQDYRCVSLGQKIDISTDYIKQQKKIAEGHRNNLLEKHKQEEEENIRKSRELMKKTKEKSQVVMKQKVRTISDSLSQIADRNKKRRQIKAKSLEKDSLPNIKKANQEIWGDRLKGQIKEVKTKIEENDQKFNEILKIQIPNEFYTGYWEKIFQFVFNRYCRYNYYTLDKVEKPPEIFFHNLEKQMIKEMREQSPQKISDSKSNDIERNAVFVESNDDLSPNAGLSIVKPITNFHEEVMLKSKRTQKIRETDQSQDKLSVTSHRTKAIRFGDSVSRKQLLNQEILRKVPTQSNYQVQVKNQFAGFNEAINHDVILKLQKNSEIVPQIVNFNDVLKLLKRQSRFCDHFKSFAKDEFLDLIRWLTFEISIDLLKVETIKEKMNQSSPNDQTNRKEKLKKDINNFKKLDKPKNNQSIIKNHKEKNQNMQSDEEYSQDFEQDDEQNQEEDFKQTKFIEPSNLDKNKSVEFLEDKSSEFDIKKQSAQNLPRYNLNEVIDNKLFMLKKDNNRQSLGKTWREKQDMLPKETSNQFLVELAKTDREIFNKVDESFDLELLDNTIIENSSVKEILGNYLTVSKFLRIQFKKTFERKIKKRKLL